MMFDTLSFISINIKKEGNPGSSLRMIYCSVIPDPFGNLESVCHTKGYAC
jgi:hypothetical protein